MRDPIAYEHLAAAIVQAPGLDGSVRDAALNQVLGKTDEPAVKAPIRSHVDEAQEYLRPTRPHGLGWNSAMSLSGPNSSDTNPVAVFPKPANNSRYSR
jgi:hypothetical protein